jgi:hypothetical protein
VSHIVSPRHLIRLTEMEVVVLCVAKRDEEANDVDERCVCQYCVLIRLICARRRQGKPYLHISGPYLRYTHAFLMGSCPCTSFGSVREGPWPRAQELRHGVTSRRSSRPSACGRHWERNRWPGVPISSCSYFVCRICMRFRFAA